MISARAAALTLVVLAATAGCESATLPSAGAPTALEFLIGGGGFPRQNVELRGDTVVVVHAARPYILGSSAMDTTRTVPTDAEWRAFWVAVETAGVRGWSPAYAGPTLGTGEGWALRLRADGRTWQSEGFGAYPQIDGEEQQGGRTPAFQALVAGLEGLTGVDL